MLSAQESDLPGCPAAAADSKTSNRLQSAQNQQQQTNLQLKSEKPEFLQSLVSGLFIDYSVFLLSQQTSIEPDVSQLIRLNDGSFC